MDPSPQHQKEEISSSESVQWNIKPLRSPNLPLGEHQNENKDAPTKNPNKRSYDDLKHEDGAHDNNNNNTGTNATADSSTSNKEEGLRVITGDEWYEDLLENYNMSSKERGYCLIINNVTFENNLFSTRKGSDMDAFRLKRVFSQLGFEVDCKRNVSSEKMHNAFRQKAALCTSKHDALAVIILSHGSELGVYGVDGIQVELNDVLTYFDNKNCRTMSGKPKMFIVQACRGRMVDYGVRNQTQSFFSQPESQQLSQFTQLNSQKVRLPQWGELDLNHNPTRTDMILCFSTQVGHVSTRNEEEGSWLGSALTTRLCQEAHRRHLMDILNMVSRDIRKCRSSEGLKQVLEVTNIGFDRHLYFNPGLSK